MNDAQPHHVELDSSTNIIEQYDVQFRFLLVKQTCKVRRKVWIEKVVKPNNNAGYQRDERVHPQQFLERPFLAVVAKETTAKVVVLHSFLDQFRVGHVEYCF